MIGCVGGTESGDSKRAFKLSLVFALGTALNFNTLGIAASLMGKLMQGVVYWWYLILGVLMILMALQTWEIFNFVTFILYVLFRILNLREVRVTNVNAYFSFFIKFLTL